MTSRKITLKYSSEKTDFHNPELVLSDYFSFFHITAKSFGRKETWASQMARVKNLSANTRGEAGSMPGSGRSPREGNGNLLQYSCLENPMDRGTWQATVHGVARVEHDLVTKPPPYVKKSVSEGTSKGGRNV